jgi:Cu+-exporting ATPase
MTVLKRNKASLEVFSDEPVLEQSARKSVDAGRLVVQKPANAVLSVPAEKLCCYHCGEPCADAAEDASLHEDGYLFCCTGCKTVYQLLRDNNLCTYYMLNEGAGISMRSAAPDTDSFSTLRQRRRFDYLEDADVERRLLHFRSAELARVEFYLPQIHCSSCLWLLEKMHKLHAGILSSRVDFMHKRVAIAYNPCHISLRELVELLTTLGYEPALHLKDLQGEAQGTRQSTAAAQDAHAQNVQFSSSPTTSLYLKLGIAGFAFANTMIFSFPEYLSSVGELDEALRRLFGVLSIALAVPVLFYSASDYFLSSWQGLRHKRINLDMPIAIGILALFVRSVVEIANGSTSGYLDSFSGLVFLLLCGRLFQQKTFDTIAFNRDYTSYFPIAVTVRRARSSEEGDGVAETTVPLLSLRVGECMVIRNHELIPADSILLTPGGHVDYSFVTGEAVPVEVVKGDTIFAGGRVVGATLEMICAKEVSQSYLTQLWNNEVFTKHERSRLETIADRFGAWFTAFVIVLATGAFVAWLPDVSTALNAATAVLVVACPCAMTLAAPFALGWTLKVFGNTGFYLKNTSVVLELTRLTTIVFDKTGTLTKVCTVSTDAAIPVRFRSAEGTMHSLPLSDDSLTAEERWMIAQALAHSTHPLARRIHAALTQCDAEMSAEAKVANATEGRQYAVQSVSEIPSQGIVCVIDGCEVRLGSAAFVGSTDACSLHGEVAQEQLPQPTLVVALNASLNASSVHVCIGGQYKGAFVVEQQYRRGVRELIAQLQRSFSLALLSGDNDSEREALQAFFPATATMRFSQSPHDKLEFVRSLQVQGEYVMMVGDGLNDAGALKQSNVGVALLEETGVFSPACDAVLAAESLVRLPDYIRLAHTAKRVILGAFWISVLYNIIGLTFACMGWLSPLFSAILMPISNATVIGFSTAAVLIAARWQRLR